MTVPKHIIWDWNGTVIDDTWLCPRLANSSWRAMLCQPWASMTGEGQSLFPVTGLYKKLGFDLINPKVR